MATSAYQLDLEPPKKNVFVTQLHEREEDDDGGAVPTATFPVVKESAARLLETGLNTLQKTLLLKKEVEVEEVDEELARKREEFRQRMEAAAQSQISVQTRQQQMKDRVAKFEKFIKENEAKRRRAIQKYQQEVKTKEQKDREYETLCAQLGDLRARNDYLKDRLAKYEKFKNYLLEVVDILPAHYLEVQDSMVTSLMMRQRTLSDTNTTLVHNLQTMSDELEAQKRHYKEAQQEHNKMKMSINSELSRKQKSQETGLGKNQEREQRVMMNTVLARTRRAEFGQIIMAIDNLAEKCVRHMDPPLDTLDLAERLDIIKNFITDKIGVTRITQEESGYESPTSTKKTSPKRKKHAKKSK